MITVGLYSLGPRVVSQVMPDIAVSHFKNYLQLDRIRNKNARKLLVDYYFRNGDTTSAKLYEAHRKIEFPELVENERVLQLINEGKYQQALIGARKTIELNPLYFDGYFNVGGCYMQLGKIDSAITYLEISNGINPNNPATLALLGGNYLKRNMINRAEEKFLRALKIDSTEENAMVGLVSIYNNKLMIDSSISLVTKLYERTEISYEYFRTIGDTYVRMGAFLHASHVYELALKRGLDSTYYRNMKERFPQLQ
jgi:tetratricopeptide (TPR) repeat protein